MVEELDEVVDVDSTVTPMVVVVDESEPGAVVLVEDIVVVVERSVSGTPVAEGRNVSPGPSVFTTPVSSVTPDAERFVVSPAQAAKRIPQAIAITRARPVVRARFFADASMSGDARPVSQRRGRQGVAVGVASPASGDPSMDDVTILVSS